MNDLRRKYITPVVSSTSFNCAHCGTLAKQFWYQCNARSLPDDETPSLWYPKSAREADFSGLNDDQEEENLKKWVMKCASGLPFLENTDKHAYLNVINFHISKCYDCGGLSLWLHDKLLWPASHEAPLPNSDLPDDVKKDYEEAGTILNSSPRGAAALLRLAVQKLCKHLDEKGKNIDDDIASLVRKGLDARIQKALDIVRVIGNNAVHPGQIDLTDDRPTAEKLFGLINLIADKMISEPKQIDEMFGDLPEGSRKAIEKRDAPKA